MILLVKVRRIGLIVACSCTSVRPWYVIVWRIICASQPVDGPKSKMAIDVHARAGLYHRVIDDIDIDGHTACQNQVAEKL